MVRRIGKVLRLEDERRGVAVQLAARSRDRPVEKVPRVKLYAGLRRADVEGASAARVDDPGSVRQAGGPAIEHEIVVVSAAKAELLVRLVDPGADAGRRPKIEGRPDDGPHFSSRNQRRIDGSE